MISRTFRSLAMAACTFALTGLLAGCALQETAAAPGTVEGIALGGRIMGGQQPVTNSAVTVYQILTTGYGQAMQGLASPLTDSNGFYSFPANSYTCPASTTPIVIMAETGNPTGTGTVSNSAISLAAMAGPCGGLTATTNIQINEVTTVATAYVLRPFATLNARNTVSTSSTNTIGIVNAYATYQLLVKNSTGASPGATVAGQIIDSARINSLANSLAACINTTGASSTNCQNLFTYSGTPTSGAAANTLTAAFNIASNPSLYVASIYNLAGATPPFGPALASAPPDWTMVILHTAGNLSTPTYALAIADTGNIFLENGSVVTKITASGGIFTNNSQVNALNLVANSISDIMVDGNENVAITNIAAGNSSLYDISQTGVTVLSVVSPDIGTPVSVEADPVGNALLVADTQQNTVRAYYLGGTIDSQTPPYVPSRLTRSPVYAATTPHQPYFASYSNPGATQIFSALGGSPTITTFVTPVAPRFTFDASHFYAFSGGSGTVTFASTATPTAVSTSTFPTTFVMGQIDGDGVLWMLPSSISSSQKVRLIALPSPSTSVVTYNYAQLASVATSYNQAAMQIDPSGNIWVASLSYTTGLTEIVGAAAPTRAPLSQTVLLHTPGTRP